MMSQVDILLLALKQLIWVLILARIVISFIPNIDPGHPIVKFVHTVTEPILAPFRAILPSTRMGFDFSPMLALFAIDIVIRILINVV